MVTIARADDLAVVGADGGAWAAPLGTAQPVDPRSAPASPWMAIGAISDDGLSMGFDEDSESFTPWGLSSPFRTVVTSSTRTFQFTMWETKRPVVRSLMFRQDIANLDPTDGVVSFAESGTVTPDRRSWIFDIYDGENFERIYVPEGEITDRGDITAAQGEMQGYEVTVTAYPDSAGNISYRSYLAPELFEVNS
ncbi:hypothetical protein Sme01_02850 [Sphaerisporangium melleum]|uniref:Phage tail protein n=1 Tax=Sphaerisporangium melleum TaxID=321316 RepID=A0A917VC04_9ACTN|nr:phage tail protein [Sphaerisporangium melleum]GGK61213.1 hypothetical protein GCM10007964_00390 [Sphaerisporangium melleum]GII67809.1 hypothetical protein Sme01_02850 [Sphaerisporangium melleum]